MSSINNKNTNISKKISKRNFLKTVLASFFGLALMQFSGIFSSFGLIKKEDAKNNQTKPTGYSAGGYGF